MPTPFTGINIWPVANVWAMTPARDGVARLQVSIAQEPLHPLTAGCVAQVTGYNHLALGFKTPAVFNGPLFDTWNQSKVPAPCQPLGVARNFQGVET